MKKPATDTNGAGNISKDMLIADILKKLPQAREVIHEHGLDCADCFINTYETLELGCMGHGMSAEEVDQMVEELNNLGRGKRLS